MLDQESDTLALDDGDPYYVFRYPDVYGDDYRNQLFIMPEEGVITGVMFGFATIAQDEYSTGDPDLVTILWETAGDSLPGAELLRDTTTFADFGQHIYDLNDEWTERYDQFVIADLRDYDLHFAALDVFHVGYSAVLNSSDDSLAILADDASTSWRSSEWYDGGFHRMSEAWRGVNFLIRVIYETSQGTGIMSGSSIAGDHSLLSAYPNPFNSQTRIAVNLAKPGNYTLDAYDILGRHIETLQQGYAAAGEATVLLDAGSWTSGVYFLRLTSQYEQAACRILLEK